MSVAHGWPAETASRVEAALTAAARELSALDARLEHYRVPEGGYEALTGRPGTEVFSLEARIGPAHRRPGYTMWAVLQVFDPAQPNLALLRVLERRDADGMPDENIKRPLYNTDLDRKVCRRFIPACNTALARLDPEGQGRGLHVDCYHGHVAPSDLVTAAGLALEQFRDFRRQGQPALIWADFHDPVAVTLVRLLRRLTARHDTTMLARTPTPSRTQVLLGGPDTIYRLAGMSSAVDEGITIARRYLTTPAHGKRASL